MAVYCSVCAAPISAAYENQGPFTCSPDFVGGLTSGKITDTCDLCGRRLASVVALAANAIAAGHRERIETLKAARKLWLEEEKARKEAEREFRRDWEQRRRERGIP
jgi:hypothetical protein